MRSRELKTGTILRTLTVVVSSRDAIKVNVAVTLSKGVYKQHRSECENRSVRFREGGDAKEGV